MEQRLTQWQHRKLLKLGFSDIFNTKIVKSGKGEYFKRFGNIYITLQIREHIIKRFSIHLLYQGVDFAFANKCCDDVKEALAFVEKLGYFK